MQLRFLLAFALSVACASVSLAQSFALTPSATRCSPDGGSVSINVTISYSEKIPSALALQIALPDGWSFLRTEGPNPPQVAPVAGDTGKLGWAFIDVPVEASQFAIVLNYRAGLSGDQVLEGALECRPATERPLAQQKVIFASR